jgi:tetratricopeptide (TPR) repeat protein
MPGYVDAYNNRGAAYYALGSYMKAIEDYNRAIEIRPDFAGAYNNRGVSYAKIGNNKLAVNDLKTAAKLGDERARNILKNNGINW